MKYKLLRVVINEDYETCSKIANMIRSGKSCDEVAEFMVSGAPKSDLEEIFDNIEVIEAFDEKIMESNKYLITYTDCGFGDNIAAYEKIK